MERDKYCTHQHMLAQIWRFIFISRKFCLAGQAQLTQHYIAVASFRLEGKLLAEMWTQGFFIFFNFNSRKVRCFSLLLVRTIMFLHLVTRHRWLASTLSPSLCSMHHWWELSCAIPAFRFPFLNYVFFFYSVTDVISNVAKYNTSVKIYLSKSKITDFKNYLKITKYTKKLLNYSNVSKCNSLLYTSAMFSLCWLNVSPTTILVSTRDLNMEIMSVSWPSIFPLWEPYQ